MPGPMTSTSCRRSARHRGSCFGFDRPCDYHGAAARRPVARSAAARRGAGRDRRPDRHVRGKGVARDRVRRARRKRAAAGRRHAGAARHRVRPVDGSHRRRPRPCASRRRSRSSLERDRKGTAPGPVVRSEQPAAVEHPVRIRERAASADPRLGRLRQLRRLQHAGVRRDPDRGSGQHPWRQHRGVGLRAPRNRHDDRAVNAKSMADVTGPQTVFLDTNWRWTTSASSGRCRSGMRVRRRAGRARRSASVLVVPVRFQAAFAPARLRDLPLLAIGGLATVPSTTEVLVNNVRIGSPRCTGRPVQHHRHSRRSPAPAT